MAQSKKTAKTELGVYVLGADMIFRSARRGMETDLVLPGPNGDARCYIIAADTDMDPIPFRTEEDVRNVILAEMRATGFVWHKKDIDDLVHYYAHETWEDYTGAASSLFASINAVNNRGRGGWEALLEAI